MFYLASFYSLMRSLLFDSHTPGKWAVPKFSGFLPTTDCYLKYSPAVCALAKEFISSLFFHTVQGFNHLKWKEPVWLHQSTSPSPAFHPSGSLLPSLPLHLYYALSFFLSSHPDCWNVLGFVIMSNMPLSRVQLGCCCGTNVSSWYLCITQKNVSIHPAHPFLWGKSFYTLFLYPKDVSL